MQLSAYIICSLPAAMLLAACAQIRGVSGGEKDITPPLLVSSVPENFSTGFNSKIIALEFDEYVQLNNVQQELIISPPQRTSPDVKLRDKRVTVELRDQLSPNTTYTLNFGKSVVDVHEANPCHDLLYVFSTGDDIDSLSVAGMITDAWDGSAVGSIKAMLYDSASLQNPFFKNPSYFARSSDDGRFIIPYLHDGQYQLLALEDLNDNFRLDPDERFAFLTETITPGVNDSTLVQHELLLSIMRPEKPSLIEYEVDSSGVLKFPWDGFYGEPDFEPLVSDGLERYHWFDTEHDTAYFWLADKRLFEDSGSGYIDVVVAWRDGILDTLEVPFFKEAMLDPVELRSNISPKWRQDDAVLISADEFLFLEENAMAELKADSLLIPCRIEKITESNRFRIEANLEEGRKYELTVMPGTFTNAASETNDTLSFSFQVYKQEELGVCNLKLSGLASGTTYHVLLEKGGATAVDETMTNNGMITMRDLIPGEYRIRIFADGTIENGLWDPADFTAGKQPERVWIYPQKITVRANWELNLEWNLMH